MTSPLPLSLSRYLPWKMSTQYISVFCFFKLKIPAKRDLENGVFRVSLFILDNTGYNGRKIFVCKIAMKSACILAFLAKKNLSHGGKGSCLSITFVI